MLAEGRDEDPVPGEPGARTSRRDFLSRAAGAAAVSAIALGGAEVSRAWAQTLSAPGRGFYNVREWGARVDGLADDTAAIQSAIRSDLLENKLDRDNFPVFQEGSRARKKLRSTSKVAVLFVISGKEA